MGKFFNIFEFIKSETAIKKGIDNEPDEKSMDNLISLMRMMDKIRERWTQYCEENYLGSPAIIITSGYRSEELNKAVGGSKTSQHRYGEACDFKAKNGQNKALFEVILDMIEEGDIECSQLIWEYGDENNPSWIHLGRYVGRKRNEVLRYEKGKGYCRYGG